MLSLKINYFLLVTTKIQFDGGWLLINKLSISIHNIENRKLKKRQNLTLYSNWNIQTTVCFTFQHKS